MQIKSKAEKEIIKIRVETNEIENRRAWVLDFLKCFFWHLLTYLKNIGRGLPWWSSG